MGDDDKFHNSGRHRADCRALNAHFREAQIAADQQIIDGNVDHQCNQRYPQRNFHGMGDAHGGEHDGGRGEKQIAEPDQLQVSHALCGDQRIIGKKQQRLMGKQADQ